MKRFKKFVKDNRVLLIVFVVFFLGAAVAKDPIQLWIADSKDWRSLLSRLGNNLLSITYVFLAGAVAAFAKILWDLLKPTDPRTGGSRVTPTGPSQEQTIVTVAADGSQVVAGTRYGIRYGGVFFAEKEVNAAIDQLKSRLRELGLERDQTIQEAQELRSEAVRHLYRVSRLELIRRCYFLAGSFVILDPLSVILQYLFRVWIDEATQNPLFALLYGYGQSLVLLILACIVSVWACRSYRRATADTGTSAAVMIAIAGVGGAGLLTAAFVITPDVFSAVSDPSRQCTILNVVRMQLFSFLILVRVFVFTLAAAFANLLFGGRSRL